MTDPGLSNRLRQRSRRAGLMVGISMALTIIICVGGAVVFYAGLVPYLSDIVPVEGREPTRVPVRAPDPTEVAPAPTAAPAEIATAPTPTPGPAEAPTATQPAFAPTHQIGAAQSVNLRPEPSTNNSPIRALAPATPLQYLNEDAPTDNPAQDGRRWMRFRTEQGEEGWVREIDTEPYQP